MQESLQAQCECVCLCVHERVCVQSRGSVCRWVWMEYNVCELRGAFVLGSGCLFWTTVLSVHRRLVGYRHARFLFCFFFPPDMWSSAVTWCYTTPPTPMPPHNVEMITRTNPAVTGRYQTENDERCRSRRSEPSFASHLINTDYRVAIELSGV